MRTYSAKDEIGTIRELRQWINVVSNGHHLWLCFSARLGIGLGGAALALIGLPLLYSVVLLALPLFFRFVVLAKRHYYDSL